jgi:hypothetical protein
MIDIVSDMNIGYSSLTPEQVKREIVKIKHVGRKAVRLPTKTGKLTRHYKV